MRSFFSLMALMALVFGSLLQASTSNPSIEQFIDNEWPKSGAPGMAYAVVIDGARQSGARGTTLAGGEVAVTADTPFLIGSITKSFTALAIMQLAEQGRVDLDHSVQEYLGEFEGQPTGTITLRQLMSHTSGFSTVQGNSRHAESGAGTETLAGHVARIAQWDLAHQPGTVWEYSNANYHVLGRVIEVVSGEDYASYVRTNIFSPLGMANSSASGDGPVETQAIGHRPWFFGHKPYRETGGDRIGLPAGGIHSSSNDLAIYLAMMMNGEDDIITAASKALMLRPASEASPFYGLGWFLDTGEGTAMHGGLVPGNETLASLKPSERKGVIVLVNTNSGIGFGENHALRNGVSALALGRDYAGEGTRIWQKATFVSVVLLPFFFVGAIVWAWRRRAVLSAKSGLGGSLSLWFPLFAMTALSYVLMRVIPAMFGGSIDTLLLFQPDFAWAMVAIAITGPLWAVVRLIIAYSGKLKAA